MKTEQALRLWLFLVASVVITFAGKARAQQKVIANGSCFNISLDDIPVGKFTQTQLPEDVMRITQQYNTTRDEGFWHDGRLMFGHDGLDIHEWGAWAGKNNVYSVQDGFVVASHGDGAKGGWGESIIVATRTHQYSDEILTMHYHHLHGTRDGGTYETTRRFNACERVSRGEVLAKEGGSGGWPVHLHWSIRRWHNLNHLKEALFMDGQGLYGPGYVFGNQMLLQNFLDPYGYIAQRYNDYEPVDGVLPDHMWSTKYAILMRLYGFEFGLYDGRFGVGEPVKRREAARWIKTAAERVSLPRTTPTFQDVQPSDRDYGAVEALTRYPQSISVINPDNSCVQGGQNFCPNDAINRAEALKMVITAFYGQEYLEIYKRQIWEDTFNTAVGLLSEFLDVDPVNWYASYVYFGAEEGLVDKTQYFHPTQPITREELSKWIIQGYQHKEKAEDFPCTYHVCPLEHFCEPITNDCVSMPQCVPEEDQPCEIGGGYKEGGGGTELPPETPDPQPDDPPSVCKCTDGLCCDGCNYRPVSSSCDLWYEYQCEGSSPGEDVERRQVKQYCSGFSSACTGQTINGGWQTWDDCSSSQQCEVRGGTPQCVGTCTDSYRLSSGRSCNNNPNTTGNPTLCLEVLSSDGYENPQWIYRICKQGGSPFQKNIKYELKDDNHLVVLDGGTLSAGSTCTSWEEISTSYLTGYGAINGAGLVGIVKSPSNCQQSSCTYKTGGITIRKECQ